VCGERSRASGDAGSSCACAAYASGEAVCAVGCDGRRRRSPCGREREEQLRLLRVGGEGRRRSPWEGERERGTTVAVESERRGVKEEIW